MTAIGIVNSLKATCAVAALVIILLLANKYLEGRENAAHKADAAEQVPTYEGGDAESMKPGPGARPL